MADQVKVFKSGTLTGADLTNSNEQVLVQTTATTKAVVKDIVVSSEDLLLADGTEATVELYNDNVKVANFGSVTGSEIIDTNSKLYYKMSPTPAVSGSFGYSASPAPISLINTTNNIYYIASSPTLIKSSVTPNYPLVSDASIIKTHFDPSFTDFTTSGSNSVTVPNMSTPTFYYTNITGNRAYYYYWDGNSTTNLRTATAINGIASGSWINVDSSSYAGWTFDLKNDVLVSSPSNTVKMVDAETNTVTTKTMSAWPGSSSYTSNAACNGYLFSSRSSSYTSQIYLTPIDTTTTGGRIMYLPASYTSGSYLSFAACYNPTEDKYYFTIGTGGGNGQLYSATGAQVSSTSNITASYHGYFDSFVPFTVASNRFISGDSDGHFFVMTNGVNHKVKMEANVATVVKSFSQSSQSNSGWFERIPTAASSASATTTDMDLDITCKVSGVEITGV